MTDLKKEEMNSKLVSVVVPFYNMEEFLEETVDSVLKSTYPDLEIVLMNDGSTDRSFEIASRLAEQYPSVTLYTQENRGVSAARNRAISLSRGTYILPVDADNRIGEEFISRAVEILEKQPDVKVVCPKSVFIGARTGEWKLPVFSLRLLAHKNMMDTCAVYRKSDWERIGGYCEEIIAREDWEFWISMLKDGGRVVRLDYVGLYYRIRENSKRVSDRSLKKRVVDILNTRHPEFFRRELNGPLRYRRSWSRFINFFSSIRRPEKVMVNSRYKELSSFVYALPSLFDREGVTIYKGRNELKEYEVAGFRAVVKSYRRPHFLNRIVYTWFRASKAERAYRYAAQFREKGIGSPEPVAFYALGNYFLFDKGYFVCLKSTCPYTYRDLLSRPFPRETEILQAIARTTARIHEAGFLHKDYSGGNILFDDRQAEIPIEIIDLNRMYTGYVDMQKGCCNFERLPGKEEWLKVMADTYAAERGFDAKACFRMIRDAVGKENKPDRK